jgi:hypothetical protein
VSFAPRIHQGLHGQHQRIDATAGDGQPIYANRVTKRVMKPAHISRNGLTQLGHAQVVRIKRLPAFQRINSRLADEIRCDLVTLAKPERQHIAEAHACVGDFADFGFFKVLDDGAHGGVRLLCGSATNSIEKAPSIVIHPKIYIAWLARQPALES